MTSKIDDSRFAEKYVRLIFEGQADLHNIPKTIRVDQTWKPGYLVFCHGVGIVSRAIRLDQRLNRDTDWEVNHVAILDAPIYDIPLSPVRTIIDWWVIQAEGHGVTGSRPDGSGFHRAKLSSVAPGGYYEVVAPPSGINLADVVGFAREEVGAEYGFFSIASLVIDQISPKWFPAFRRRDTWICSALAAEALRAGGWLHDWDDVYQVRPAQLRAAVKIDSNQPSLVS